MLCLLPFAAMAGAEPASLFSGKGEEWIRVQRNPETGTMVTEQQKVNFHPKTQYRRDTNRHLIIRETFLTKLDEGLEGSQSKLKMELFIAADNGVFPKSPSSTLEIPEVHDAKYEDNHWSALTYGCCDAETYGRLYTYGGQKPFLRYNENYWTATVPNAELLRYVGMALRDHVANDAARDALFGAQPQAVACIGYSSANGSLGRIYLIPSEEQGWKDHSLHTEKLALSSRFPKDEARADQRTIEMWSLDGAEAANKGRKEVSGLIIIGTLAAGNADSQNSVSVSVKVDQDRLVEPTVTGGLLKAVVTGPE